MKHICLTILLLAWFVASLALCLPVLPMLLLFTFDQDLVWFGIPEKLIEKF